MQRCMKDAHCVSSNCAQPHLGRLLTCCLLFTDEYLKKNTNLINDVRLELDSSLFAGEQAAEQSLGAGTEWERLPVNHSALQISAGVNRHSNA